jgi:hypothetical protein
VDGTSTTVPAARHGSMTAMRRTILLLSAALLLSACTGGAGAVTATGPAHPTATPSAVRTTRSCDDPSRDRGPVDLQQVSLRSLGSRLTATFRLAAPPETVPGVLQLSLGIWSGNGAASRALDIRWVDGEPRVRMYDVLAAEERELPVRPDVSGGTVTVRFPAAATAGLGRSWRWEAFATVDGTDVDDCPSR